MKNEFNKLRSAIEKAYEHPVSNHGVAELLGLESERSVRRYMSGDRGVSGPIRKLMTIYARYPGLLDEKL